MAGNNTTTPTSPSNWGSWNGGALFPNSGSYAYNPNSTGGLAYSGPGAVSNYGFGFQPNSMTPITAATANANTGNTGTSGYNQGYAAALANLSLGNTLAKPAPSTVAGSGLTGSVMRGLGMSGTWPGLSAQDEQTILGGINSALQWKNVDLLDDQLAETKANNAFNRELGIANYNMKFDSWLPEFELAQGKAKAVGDWVASQGGDASKFNSMANMTAPTRAKLVG